MKRSVILATSAALLVAVSSVAYFGWKTNQSEQAPAPPPPGPVIYPAASDQSGRAAYIRACGICHEPGGPAALQLARRLPAEQAILTNRTDLTSDAIQTIVRNGIGSMPALPRGGVSDDDLRKIGDYLSAPKGHAR